MEEHYPSQGCKPVAVALGLTATQVREQANKRKIVLNSDARRRLVHSAAQRYMTDSNPMRRPEVAAKVSQWAKSTSAGQAHLAKLVAGSQRAQREKPSKPEMRLRSILDSLGVAFEPSALIKPKFIVDIRIGTLIIQLDGEYWHGHPRYEPLTERQRKQRQRDSAQDAYLLSCGYTVIRIWESQLTVDHVARVVADHAADRCAAGR